MHARALRRLGAAASILILLASCGGGGAPAGTGSTGAVPPTPTASPTPISSPTPTPAPAPAYVGAVYAGTNNYGPAGNWVVGFGRRADGTLVAMDVFETGGSGRAGASFTPPRLNPLISEDSIIAVGYRFVLVVNAGTNDVTCFRINADFSLTRTDREPSGGTAPISLAYQNGVVYVANADEDGSFTAPFDQSGNITAMRLDIATGQLTRISGFSYSLRGRPSDVEVTSNGAYLLVSSLNAGSPQLPQPTAAEVSSFRINSDGTLVDKPAGTGMSTPLNNPGGRNLPNAIGIETFERKGRQFLIAAEARTVSATGVPAASFAALQTGSVSMWEILSDGTLVPRAQDFLLGSSVTSGPTQAGFLAYSPLYDVVFVASSAGAELNSLNVGDDGTLQRATGAWHVKGVPANPSATNPLADGDGFVDLAIRPDGNGFYQLVGLKGRIDRYEIVFGLERQQQITTGLLPMDNLQGLVAVSR